MAKTKLTLSAVCAGMIYYKQAVGRAPDTIAGYRHAFAKLQTFLPGDPPFASITRARLVEFFAWLRDLEITPAGVAPRPAQRLSDKTILNIHTALSALWRWAVDEGQASSNIVRAIEPPRAQSAAIEPLTRDEVAAILRACAHSRPWASRPSTVNARPTADRDAAIVLFLVDTGVRASELCGLTLADLNLGAGSARVLGKGNKERVVHFGKSTTRALWKLVTPAIAADARSDSPIFTAAPGKPLDRSVLRKLLARLGDRAGVPGVHPHRFRHTFAITYIRNGGDLFTLQALLGHTDLSMVRRYAKLAQSDLADAHRRASPADNWKL